MHTSKLEGFLFLVRGNIKGNRSVNNLIVSSFTKSFARTWLDSWQLYLISFVKGEVPKYPYHTMYLQYSMRYRNVYHLSMQELLCKNAYSTQEVLVRMTVSTL